MTSGANCPDPQAVGGSQLLQIAVLGRVWSAPWRHLPVLAVAAVASGLPLTIAVLLTSGISVLTPLLAALWCGPTLIPLLGAVQDALVHDDTELSRYARSFRRCAARSTAYSLIPGLSLTALLAALEVHARTGSGMVLIPLALSVSCSVLTLAGLVALLPLAAARPALRGYRLWLTAWYLLGRWPVRYAAPLALGGLALWTATTLHTSLILLLPAPVALLAGAAHWCCAIDLGARGFPVRTAGEVISVRRS